jgi:hypothetical protein
LAILGIILFVFIGGQIVMYLWNWLLPPLFGFREIGFWQALGVLILCRILFGGFGMSGSGGSRSRHARNRIADRVAERVAERLDERYDNMTPEERERLRQRMRERWGTGSTGGETQPL